MYAPTPPGLEASMFIILWRLARQHAKQIPKNSHSPEKCQGHSALFFYDCFMLIGLPRGLGSTVFPCSGFSRRVLLDILWMKLLKRKACCVSWSEQRLSKMVQSVLSQALHMGHSPRLLCHWKAELTRPATSKRPRTGAATRCVPASNPQLLPQGGEPPGPLPCAFFRWYCVDRLVLWQQIMHCGDERERDTQSLQ